MLVDKLRQLDALNESISQATLELESKQRKSASAYVLGQAHLAPRLHALSALSEHVTSIESNADRIADVLRRPISTSNSLVLDPKHHQFSYHSHGWLEYVFT
ncbi:hypothetical protein HDU78_005781 [Chytriomyces hyalinus]|nr:hypothetical protein HDU78_005781 [Chytriomyces hyalinus]